MSELIVEKFGDKTIRIIKECDEYWFVVKDICKVLGLTNPTETVKNINVKYKKIQKIRSTCGIQETSIIHHKIVCSILHRSRKTDKAISFLDHFSKYIGNNSIIPLYKESEFIGLVERSLQIFKPVRQFPIGKYFIDLYFPDYRLAIECDEYDHKKMKKPDELLRQKNIEDHLQCRFIRFDPDQKKFDIALVIDKILRELVSLPDM